MFQDKPAWVAHQRARWLRPDAHLFVRPDAHRFMPPGAPRLLGKDAVRYFWPDAPSERRASEPAPLRGLDLSIARASLRRLKGEVAALQAELRFRRFLRDLKAGFNPDQPRDDHGRWTDDNGSGTDGGGGGSSDDRQTRLSNDEAAVAQIEMGVLLGQAIVHPTRGGGKDCFYQFSYGIVAIRWSANFSCSPTLPWFAATHGRLIK